MCGNVEDILTHAPSIPSTVEVEDAGGTDLPDGGGSGFPDLKKLRETLKEVNIAPIERALTRPIGAMGRRQHPRGPIIRAFLSRPVRGIKDITALREELMDNPALRAVCGFTTRVPSRSTFSRVFGQLKGSGSGPSGW